jgi:hypothetical protein
LDGVWDHPDVDVQAHFNDLRASWINTPIVHRVGVIIKPFDCTWGSYMGALVMSHSPMWISWGTEPRKILVTALSILRPLWPTLDEIRDAFPPNQPSLAQHAAWMREAITQKYLPPAAVEYDRGSMHSPIDTGDAWERHIVDERATSGWDSSSAKGRAAFTWDQTGCPRPKPGDTILGYFERRFADSARVWANKSRQQQESLKQKTYQAVEWKLLPNTVPVYVWSLESNRVFTCELQTREQGKTEWENSVDIDPWEVRVDQCYGVCKIAPFFSKPAYANIGGNMADDDDLYDDNEWAQSSSAKRYRKQYTALLLNSELDAIWAYKRRDALSGWSTARPESPQYFDPVTPPSSPIIDEAPVDLVDDDTKHDMPDITSHKLVLTNGVKIQPVHVDDILHTLIGFQWLGQDSQPPAHLRQWQLARNQKTFMSSLSRVWTILGKVDWPLRGTESPSLATESEIFRLSEAKLGSQLLTFFSDMEFYGYELKSNKDGRGLIKPSDVRKAELCRPLAGNWAHHPDSWDETWADALSGGLRLWSISLIQIWLPPDGLLGDHVPTTAYALHRCGSSHQTQMPPIILFDPMVIWLILLNTKGVYNTYRRIMAICGHSGIRFCLPGYRQSVPDVVTAQAFKGYRQNEISRRASTCPGFTRSVTKGCDASMWRAWKGAVAHLLRNPRFAKAALR